MNCIFILHYFPVLRLKFIFIERKIIEKPLEIIGGIL